MTTVAAVKKGKRLCLASDTLTTLGSRKEVADKHGSRKGKIIQIGPNYIGTTGHASWGLILSHYFSKKKISEWKSEKEIFEVFVSLHQELKDMYYLSPSAPPFLPFESSEFPLLIINCYGIFEVGYSRAVCKCPLFSAIGSGEEYALGAIKSIYDSLENSEEIAKIGIEAAARFDQKTALPIHTCCIDFDEDKGRRKNERDSEKIRFNGRNGLDQRLLS